MQPVLQSISRPHLAFGSPELTRMIREETVFRDLDDLVYANGHAAYTPALREDIPAQRAIADAYDAWHAAHGFSKRASISRESAFHAA